tara:strand:+ start:559 stop:891 length:333 start_codon:yes stop_codon:yes gene_type:complete
MTDARIRRCKSFVRRYIADADPDNAAWRVVCHLYVEGGYKEFLLALDVPLAVTLKLSSMLRSETEWAFRAVKLAILSDAWTIEGMTHAVPCAPHSDAEMLRELSSCFETR